MCHFSRHRSIAVVSFYNAVPASGVADRLRSVPWQVRSNSTKVCVGDVEPAIIQQAPMLYALEPSSCEVIGTEVGNKQDVFWA